jgi:hypothetical protein
LRNKLFGDGSTDSTVAAGDKNSPLGSHGTSLLSARTT